MNYRVYFFVLLSIVMQSHCMIPVVNNLSRVIVDENKKPTSILLKILKETNIEHDGTLKTIFIETQKKWLRTAGKERWEIDPNCLTFTFDSSLGLLKDLFLVQEIKPLNQYYNYAILHGATLDTVRDRLNYLIMLWNHGIRFDSIIVFSGERPMNQVTENSELLLDVSSPSFPFKQNWQFNGQLPETETEMIQLVFDQLDVPTQWNNIPIIFVNTPMQKTENGALRRPNTQDTVEEWLRKYRPREGSILAISNQPFIGYQDAVLRTLVPTNFMVETVGSACSDDTTVAIILDSLARWIYVEYHNN